MSASASVGDLSKLRREFLLTTGLRESNVEKIQGGVDCLEGDLYLLEIEEYSSLTLMLGGKTLITGIGTATTTEKERGCLSTRTVQVGPGQVSFKRSLCAGKLHEWSIVVTATARGFEYAQLNTTDRKVTVNQVCKYQYIADSN